MWWTYASIVSVFSSKLKDLHTWNDCSLVFPILEYCYLSKFCNSCQSTFTGSNDWYHNLCFSQWCMTKSLDFQTLNKVMYIHPVIWMEQMCPCILIRFPWNSGLKFDQFKCTTCCCCWSRGYGWGCGLGWKEIWCGNTFFMICHLCFTLNFILSLIYSCFILAFFFCFDSGFSSSVTLDLLLFVLLSNLTPNLLN